MTNGRPPDDGSSQSPRRRRDKVANAGGLEALGKQLDGGSASGNVGGSGVPGRAGVPGSADRVANEAGLAALGARVDAGAWTADDEDLHGGNLTATRQLVAGTSGPQESSPSGLFLSISVRDLPGDALASRLRRYGYEPTRQTGSHLRLTSTLQGQEHHVTVPRHDHLRVGTLSAIPLRRCRLPRP